jgi:CYTH domain-containing protein/CHAD domain-containing protein
MARDRVAALAAGTDEARPGIEIERKFLVADLPGDLERYPSQRIVQGYVVIGDQTEVRARRSGERTSLTIKTGSGRIRGELEIAVDEDQFARLWDLTEDRTVEKRRNAIPAGEGHTIELDRYEGVLDGLTTAEIEFASEAEADAFEPPPWLGPEITEDPRYKNQRLAGDGAPEPPRARSLSFSLRRDEKLGDGIRRIVRGEIDLAIDELTAGSREDPDEAVHACRKSFKRVRALLRLVRDEIDAAVYQRERAAFRDLGRSLSSARDSQVMIETLDDLRERHDDELPPDSFEGQRSALTADHAAAERRLRAGGGPAPSVIADLRAARRRVAAWEFEHDDPSVLAAGLARAQRRCRRSYRRACKHPGDESFHELRKRTQDLWHAAELLAPLDPKAMRPIAAKAHRLSELIGQDHDLAVLSQRTSGHSKPAGSRGEAIELDALISRRRRKLQRDALRLGRRLLNRRPRKLASRL